MKIILLILLPMVVTGQRMATPYGQHLHSDFDDRAKIERSLQDCSGEGTTWGPGIGPPPTGCEGSGGPPSGGFGGGGTSGQSTSTECAVTSGTCSTDGSTNSGAIRDLIYSSTTGKFTGTITTNQCNDHERIIQGGGSAPGNNAVSCIQQTIPTVTGSTASAIPTLGTAALTISGGVNIYSAFEAGFNDCAVNGMPCACDGASCAAGMDVGACEAHLHYSCTSEVSVGMFMDTCGGHADPYHIHTDPICNYETDTATGHSTLLGVSLDGYGIYGKFETLNQRPCDLDVCHGHVGSVPASSTYGTTSSSVYHYHVSDYAGYPFTWTLGCYGNPTTPVDLATCESLYDGCGSSGTTETIYTAEYPDGKDVKLWCPCFEVPVFEGCDSTEDEKDSGEWTCVGGWWYEGGVLTSYPCSSDGSDDKDDTGYESSGEKEESCTDTSDGGMPSGTYPRTCIETSAGTRCWYTYTPSGVVEGATYPLVIDLHGGGGCASDSMALSGWKSLADEELFIVIWPQGSNGEWGVAGSEWETVNSETTSEGGKETFNAPDVSFLTSLISTTSAPINPERIYTTGFSMGCMMALRFLLEKSDIVAGAHCHGGYLVAPNAGTSITPNSGIGVYMTGGSDDDWYAMSSSQFSVWKDLSDPHGSHTVTTTSVTLSGTELTSATLETCGSVSRLVVAGMTHVYDERMAALAWDALKGFSRPGAADDLEEKVEVVAPEEEGTPCEIDEDCGEGKECSKGVRRKLFGQMVEGWCVDAY
ncbi:hypothetical protein TrST_g7558 [Triparma strigata]|uniref:Feruloyl esterase n=1 Tax=Triparma strigata TaxID=1606541 RepID=A0A9W7AR55_9STRA|nr:hypothetical protein TrST_g7558 [Triparma strigata]